MPDALFSVERPRSVRDCVAYAVQAPSSCNSQPWRFRILADAVELRADRTRALAVIDPFDRELVIACGAALFNLRLALAAGGWNAAVDVVPSASDPDLLARVVLLGRADPTEDVERLFAAIPRRRTFRGSFEPRAVERDVLVDLVRRARGEGAFLEVLEGERRASALACLARAEESHAHDAHVLRERAVWLARGRPDVDPNAEPGLGGIHARPPVLVLFGTRHEEPAAWLDAGQALEHVLLAATLAGVRASFHDEPVEFSLTRPSLSRLLGRPGFAQVLVGLGHAPPARAGARRPLADVLDA